MIIVNHVLAVVNLKHWNLQNSLNILIALDVNLIFIKIKVLKNFGRNNSLSRVDALFTKPIS